MEPPETRYAKSGDLHIAYQVVGEGQPLVVSDQWFGNVDAQWEFPPMERFLRRLASFRRLVLFDKRGIDRTALLSGVGLSYVGILFAATYPERTSALVLVNGYARISRAPAVG